MRVEVGPEYAVKQAEDPQEGARLALEAEALSTFAHPGLVRLVERTPPSGPVVDRIVTATTPGGQMSDAVGAPCDLLAGWAAAVATVLGDLHSVGLAHGAVTADHILLDPDGRPVLCGLARSVRQEECSSPEVFEAACNADLRALAAVLTQMCPPGRDSERLLRRLTRWERGLRGRRGAWPHLRPPKYPRGSPGGSLATAILEAVPSARVGPPPPVAPGGRDGGSTVSLLDLPAKARDTARTRFFGVLPVRLGRGGIGGIALAAVVLTIAAVLFAGTRSSTAAASGAAKPPKSGAGSVLPGPAPAPVTAAAGPAASPSRPAVDSGASTGSATSTGSGASPGPVAGPEATGDRTATAPVVAPDPSDTVADLLPGYQLKTPTAGRALTVLGRWGCGPERPAVLYLGNGSVWVFSSWPSTGTAVGAAEAAMVPDAEGLAVEGGTGGCDQLVVLRANGATDTVPTGGRQ